MSDIDQGSLFFFNGFICCFSGIYTAIPACIGAAGAGECLCLTEECCLKADRLNKEGLLLCSPCVVPNQNGEMCRLGVLCTACGLKMPSTCCKSQGQCCCMVSGAALPTDSDVPTTCGICFISLYPKFGILKKVGDLK